MDRNSFINFVENRDAQTSNDQILISILDNISDYFKELHDGLLKTKTDAKYSVGGTNHKYSFSYDGIMLEFVRLEDKIDVILIHFDNRPYKKEKYDSYIINKDVVISEKSGSKFSQELLNELLVLLKS